MLCNWSNVSQWFISIVCISSRMQTSVYQFIYCSLVRLPVGVDEVCVPCLFVCFFLVFFEISLWYLLATPLLNSKPLYLQRMDRTTIILNCMCPFHNDIGAVLVYLPLSPHRSANTSVETPTENFEEGNHLKKKLSLPLEMLYKLTLRYLLIYNWVALQ